MSEPGKSEELDEYDRMNVLLEFTEDELKLLDGACVSNPDPRRTSPFETYRKGKGKTFSVTDLVAPAWCEVQFDYGLRQKRHRPLKERPKAFVTEQGKLIQANENVSKKNDVRLDLGRIVHAKLEREIFPEKIIISSGTAEEKWALRLLQMMSCLEVLKTKGICVRLNSKLIDTCKRPVCREVCLTARRLTFTCLTSTPEVPVFGFVGTGRLVVGVIDEIRATDTTKETASVHGSDKQQRLDQFLIQPQREEQVTSCLWRLVDTKTRQRKILPSYSDALPSRLQLMLYKALLQTLVDLAQPFDFPALWNVLSIDQHKHFSTAFLDAVALLCESNGLTEQTRESMCLSNVVNAWMNTLLSFNVQRFIVDDKLLVVYRKRRVWGVEGNKLQTGSDAGTLERCDDSSTERSLKPAEAASLADSMTDDRNVPHSSVPEQSVIPESDVSLDSQHLIIGSLGFEFDPLILNHHLSNVLDWWDGHRLPVGVSLEDIGRCRSCEYEDGCEWLEQKSKTLMAQKGIKAASR